MRKSSKLDTSSLSKAESIESELVGQTVWDLQASPTTSLAANSWPDLVEGRLQGQAQCAKATIGQKSCDSTSA